VQSFPSAGCSIDTELVTAARKSSPNQRAPQASASGKCSNTTGTAWKPSAMLDPATPAGLSAYWRRINRVRSRTRACGEHPFLVIKRLWGFTKVRYRGLAKNLARAYMLFGLANLYRMRRQLLPAGARCVG
jgi:hypothetical protein